MVLISILLRVHLLAAEVAAQSGLVGEGVGVVFGNMGCSSSLDS